MSKYAYSHTIATENMTANRSKTGFSDRITWGIYCKNAKHKSHTHSRTNRKFLNSFHCCECDNALVSMFFFYWYHATTYNTCENTMRKISCGSPISMHLATWLCIKDNISYSEINYYSTKSYMIIKITILNYSSSGTNSSQTNTKEKINNKTKTYSRETKFIEPKTS